MKGFFGVILVLILSVFVITIFITQNDLNNKTYENNHYVEATKLNNYQIILTQKTWDTNWENPKNELIQDFNISSTQIITSTFGKTNCITNNWDINNIEKTINFDINCTLIINNYQEEKYLNYSKKIVLK